jgi:hypothetical protein
LVDSVESMMMYGLVNPKFKIVHLLATIQNKGNCYKS